MKNFITAVLSVMLLTGNAVFAGSNDLLRMDVKKASAGDTLDVTFYTTGTPTNAVVTRKTGNTYVVLLPNVSGNQSVVPSLGGVKDLVSNVNVKNVDDGVGGYTKITFDAVKPLKIQTYSKKTAPLTKAQQDYKNLIAQNDKYNPDKKIANFKQSKSTNISDTKVSNVVKAPVASKQNNETKNQPQKTAQNKSVSVNNQNQTAQKKSEKTLSKTNQTINTTAQLQPEQKIKENITPQPETQNNKESNAAPLTQAVSSAPLAAVKPVSDLAKSPAESGNLKKTQKNPSGIKVKIKDISKGLPILPLAGALSALGILLLGVLMNVASKAIKSNAKLKEYLENYNSAPKPANTSGYNAILKKENLNWREKYKLYSQTKKSEETNKAKASYITNMSGSNGKIVSDDMKTKISQMESALSRSIPVLPSKTKTNDVQSEEDTITSRMSGLNLKTFAKNINLKTTNRQQQTPKSRNNATNPLKEGQHVNLENSGLTMSQRNIGGHGFSISDLLRTGRRYLSQKNNNDELSRQQDEYLVSSLEDYLNIIEAEEYTTGNNVTEEITNMIPRRYRTNVMHSSNPVSKPNYPFKHTESSTAEFAGITVSSKYDIDNNKSIYMVESDGVSAIIGKVGDNITVLKKFDRIIHDPLQVRLDYGDVFIVRVGGFKCLVDVSEEKMGTLLEI